MLEQLRCSTDKLHSRLETLNDEIIMVRDMAQRSEAQLANMQAVDSLGRGGGQKTAACVPCGGVSCDARDDVEAASVTLSVANQAGDAAEQFPAVAAATHEGLSASGCKEAASSAADDCRMCQMDGHQRAAAIGAIEAHPAAHIGWHLGLCGDCLADASDQAYGPDLQG